MSFQIQSNATALPASTTAIAPVPLEIKEIALTGDFQSLKTLLPALSDIWDGFFLNWVNAGTDNIAIEVQWPSGTVQSYDQLADTSILSFYLTVPGPVDATLLKLRKTGGTGDKVTVGNKAAAVQQVQATGGGGQ